MYYRYTVLTTITYMGCHFCPMFAKTNFVIWLLYLHNAAICSMVITTLTRVSIAQYTIHVYNPHMYTCKYM